MFSFLRTHTTAPFSPYDFSARTLTAIKKIKIICKNVKIAFNLCGFALTRSCRIRTFCDYPIQCFGYSMQLAIYFGFIRIKAICSTPHILHCYFQRQSIKNSLRCYPTINTRIGNLF